MAPTKSGYTREVKKEDGTVTRERGFDGKDYLDIWAADNGREVMEQERLDRESAESKKPAQ